MTLIRIGRSIIDNDLSFFYTCPAVDKLIKIPVMYSFPGRKITLYFPTPLILAIYLNRPEISKWNLKFFFSFYETPLHVAAYYGCFDAVYRLLVNGADINAYINGDDSKTPLNVALYGNHKAIIAYLLHKGADSSRLNFINAPNPDEMIQFVNEGYLKDEYNEEKLVSRSCTGRIEDVLEFEYPSCPEIDPTKRYVNQEYIKEIQDRNRYAQSRKSNEDHKDDDNDDGNAII